MVDPDVVNDSRYVKDDQYSNLIEGIDCPAMARAEAEKYRLQRDPECVAWEQQWVADGGSYVLSGYNFYMDEFCTAGSRAWDTYVTGKDGTIWAWQRVMYNPPPVDGIE